MNPKERELLFDICCRSKTNKSVSRKEYKFCEKMFALYPEEYHEMEKRVFEATVPFGSFIYKHEET